ncbi:MAG: ABC transporter permease [Rhodospirillaceae bacterium]|jgi:peptide/nickel transport system permease protein|nr:ABC transporter permease [Rhodospirillaceae bacterium]MBT4487594.1 ABC transporter permease [Rhodospirillaceae bacterium]MBT5192104.1 ABC transporter permease [Rhodospirillaceae bacterium]MBT5897428.1 ABC transporter permease [Rhodospirillaceae bacterium]MBT6428351.1 ABC transporter permease [Rhodospirillaceae bacterium]
MAVNETYIEIQDEVLAERTWGSVAKDLIRRQPLGAAGGLVVILMISAAVFSNQIDMYDPEVNDFGAMLQAPSWDHLFGTDEFGRDIYSRIVHGARTAMLVGFTAAILGSTIGLLIGVTSAYFGGWVDIIIQRVVDILIAFPSIILALAIVIILGRGVGPVIVAITIPLIPNCARVVRSSALAVREIPYVDAARAMGYGHVRIVLRYISPNIMAPYLIMLTTFLGQAILAEASLSYLGLGVQEPTPAWGLMLKSGAEEYAESAPWAVIFPGVAISLAVFGFNLFGDALRDVLDPKLRDR